MSVDTRVEVELDVFSGRPNPRWVLAAEQAEKLLADLADRAPADPQEVPGLGYRGFVLNNLGQDRRIPHRLRVYDGVVTIIERDRETYEQDRHGVERALLEYAERLGYGELIEHFRVG